MEMSRQLPGQCTKKEQLLVFTKKAGASSRTGLCTHVPKHRTRAEISHKNNTIVNSIVLERASFSSTQNDDSMKYECGLSRTRHKATVCEYERSAHSVHLGIGEAGIDVAWTLRGSDIAVEFVCKFSQRQVGMVKKVRAEAIWPTD